MFGVLLELLCFFRLLLHGMQFTVRQEHWLRGVLVVMGESVVSLSEVESEYHHGQRADQVLLEGELGELGCLHGPLSSEQVVLVLVELLLDLTSKHFY